MDVARSHRSVRPKLWLAIAAATLALGIAAMVARADPASVRIARDSVWVATVERGEMVQEVRARGRLAPVRVRWVTALTPGRIERILARSGDEVAVGGALFELDNSDLALELAQAKANLASARVGALANTSSRSQTLLDRKSQLVARLGDESVADQNAESLQALGSRGWVPDLDHKEAQARRVALAQEVAFDRQTLELLRAAAKRQASAERDQLADLEALVELHQARLAALTVRSAVAGVVQDVTVHEGQWIAAGEVLGKVADPSELEAVLEVPGAQARDVAVGQRVSLEISTSAVAGKVSRVAPSVHEGTVEVRVQLPRTLPAGARAELAIHASIELSRIPDAMFVERPAQAAPNQHLTVYRLDSSGTLAKAVQLEFGAVSARTIEVLNGAEPGDEIIVSDMSKYAQHETVELR